MFVSFQLVRNSVKPIFRLVPLRAVLLVLVATATSTLRRIAVQEDVRTLFEAAFGRRNERNVDVRPLKAQFGRVRTIDFDSSIGDRLFHDLLHTPNYDPLYWLNLFHHILNC